MVKNQEEMKQNQKEMKKMIKKLLGQKNDKNDESDESDKSDKNDNILYLNDDQFNFQPNSQEDFIQNPNRLSNDLNSYYDGPLPLD